MAGELALADDDGETLDSVFTFGRRLYLVLRSAAPTGGTWQLRGAYLDGAPREGVLLRADRGSLLAPAGWAQGGVVWIPADLILLVIVDEPSASAVAGSRNEGK